MRAGKNQRLTADLLSIYQVAAALEVSVSTVHEWNELGYIPASITFGGRRRWRLSHLQQWAAADFPRRQPEPKKGTKAKA
jgi:excisionase family DNA binding protein